MMTSWHGNPSILLALCNGNPPVTGGFPLKWSVRRRSGAFFVVNLNKLLRKLSSCRGFGTLWRSCDATVIMGWYTTRMREKYTDIAQTVFSSTSLKKIREFSLKSHWIFITGAANFEDDVFKCIFLNKNVYILITISLKLVPNGWSNEQHTSIGSDNDSASTRRQAIIWTIAGYSTDAYTRHTATMS